MHKLKRYLAIVLLLVFLTSISYAADVNYPYAEVKLSYPPDNDPFPGLGSYYSTLCKGMKSALWNPASLGKLKLSESSISMLSTMQRYAYQRTTKFNELSGTMEAGEYGLFFRYPTDIGTGINTKEVSMLSTANYAPSGSGINFNSALKINDWLTIGFASNSPFTTDINLAGDFPITTRLNTDLYGESIDKMQIGSDGKLSYTFGSGTSTLTYESISPLWSGFLSQEVTIPLTTLSELRDNINIQSSYMGTLASRFGNLYLGLNMIPISATANIDNELRTVINADTEDQYFYVPNFDPTNQSELSAWINESDQYGTSNGYKRKTIRIPSGQIVAATRYRGFYAATTTRLDFGSQYDISEWLTIGVAIENSGGSSLNFKGSGTSSYINYRNINTAEAGSLTDLLQPGGTTAIDLVTDTWVTTTEVSGTKLYLEPEKTYDLPKRIRYGIALKRPFLIAIDYEQNQTPLKYKTTENGLEKEIIISDLNLLRIGLDMALIKTGLTLLMKPTITGADQATQDQINTYFRYGALPVKFDLGTEFNLWGLKTGSSFGINALSLINVIQLDTSNMDLSKLVYANIYFGKDPWQISYLLHLDLLATGMAYGSKTVPAGETKSFEVSDAKYIQTIGVTYRF